MYHSMFLHGDPSTRKPVSSAMLYICCGRIRTLASLTARARSRTFSATWTHAECGLGRPKSRKYWLKDDFDGQIVSGNRLLLGGSQRGEPDSQWKAAAFVRRHQPPYESRVQRNVDRQAIPSRKADLAFSYRGKTVALAASGARS